MMSKCEQNAKLNREHLLKPVNLVMLAMIIVIIPVLQDFGYTKIAVGYYLASSLIFAQVLLTRNRLVFIRPANLLIIDPLIFTGIVYVLHHFFG